MSLTNALVGSATGDVLKVTGGSGNDIINAAGVATAANREQIFAGAGNDILTGGAGADSFSFAAKDLPADTVTGGGGTAPDQWWEASVAADWVPKAKLIIAKPSFDCDGSPIVTSAIL